MREQRVPLAEEQDGLDGSSTHFVVWDGRSLVGTARLRRLPDGRVKAERVAVRRDFRRRGVGSALMASLESFAQRHGASAIVLHSQADAIPFYRHLGYHPYGEPFVDAGILHRAMAKVLRGGRSEL